MITINHELYGERAEFETIEAAEAEIRSAGDEFATVSLNVRGSRVINERGDVVGSVEN